MPGATDRSPGAMADRLGRTDGRRMRLGQKGPQVTGFGSGERRGEFDRASIVAPVDEDGPVPRPQITKP